MSRAEMSLQRMLVLVPYVLQHQGVGMEEVCELFGVSREQLVEDLSTLIMTGTPPYGPGDLIDYDLDDEGRLWIRMADHFAKPLRLTRMEALALYLRGMEALSAPGLPEAPSLSSVIDKLRSALSEELVGVDGALDVASSTAREVGPLSVMQQAAADHERVEVEYYSHARDVMSARTIDPEHVFWDSIAWYVVAWDSLADAERTFRLDRMAVATPTGEHFEPRGLQGPGRDLVPSDGEVTVRLRLRPEARWVSEYVRADIVEEHEDEVIVEIHTTQLPWVVKLALRLGSGADVLAPPGLTELVREEAVRTLALYRKNPQGD